MSAEGRCKHGEHVGNACPICEWNAGHSLAEPAGSASVIVAEGYYRIKGEHEKLKELCAIVEPWASHDACNNRSVSHMADDVYRACLEMRRIIYSPNAKALP